MTYDRQSWTKYLVTLVASLLCVLTGCEQSASDPKVNKPKLGSIGEKPVPDPKYQTASTKPTETKNDKTKSVDPGDDLAPPPPPSAKKSDASTAASSAGSADVKSGTPKAGDVKVSDAKTGADKADGKPAEITIKDVNLAGFEQAITSRKGSFVAVDMWANWCGECKERMPVFAELSTKYKAKVQSLTLAVESEDLDEAKENLAGIKGLAATHYRLNMGELESLEKKLKFEGVPRYLLYDPKGEIIFTGNHVNKLGEAMEKLVK